ncbi:MAG: hypothetical protein H0T92_16915, partial [Pyrinomonadaceae bacterium]|nr:hypothetical protein [Pyrinomonadaceae bacterium]
MTTPLDTSRETARLQSLLESAQMLHASLDLEDLLRHLLRSVMGRLLVGRGLIAVEDNGAMRLRLVRGFKTFNVGDVFDEQTARAAGVHIVLPIGDDKHPTGLLGLSRPPGGDVEADEEESLR